MEDIIKRIDSGIFYDINYNASYFEFKKKFNIKVIIDIRVIEKIRLMMNCCVDDNREYGCFIYGKSVLDDVIYFDDISKYEFDSYYDEVKVSSDSVDELKRKTMQDSGGNRYDSVMHFHTHPNGDDMIYNKFSFQDLYVYGILQTKFQFSYDKTQYYGGVSFIDDNSCYLKIVVYDDVLKKFYEINNVYLYDGNIMKLENNNGLLISIDNLDKNKLVFSKKYY